MIVASVRRRMFAWLLDLPFILGPQVLIGYGLYHWLANWSLPLSGGDPELRSYLIFMPMFYGCWFLAMLVPFFYHALMMLTPWQASIGKRILRLELTDLAGQTVQVSRRILRALVYAISQGIATPLIFLLAYIFKDRQSLHDLSAKTVVRVRR